MPNTTATEKPLTLTVDEVAEELQLHPNTIYDLLRAGEIPGLKIGGAWRIPRSRLVEYLEEGSAA